MKKPDIEWRLVVILLVPALAISGLFLYQYSTVALGDEIEIEVVEPVDPRDIFRGNYATLRYSISRLDIDELPGGDNFNDGDTVYVTLVRQEDYWVASGVSDERPLDAEYCIQGEIQHSPPGSIEVRYGIEEFFADPERAQRIEDERWSSQVSGIVVVDSWCRSVLRGVRLGDEVLRTR